jgi:hypothetical protein
MPIVTLPRTTRSRQGQLQGLQSELGQEPLQASRPCRARRARGCRTTVSLRTRLIIGLPGPVLTVLTVLDTPGLCWALQRLGSTHHGLHRQLRMPERGTLVVHLSHLCLLAIGTRRRTRGTTPGHTMSSARAQLPVSPRLERSPPTRHRTWRHTGSRTARCHRGKGISKEVARLPTCPTLTTFYRRGLPQVSILSTEEGQKRLNVGTVHEFVF